MIGAWPSTVSSSGVPVLANGGPMMALTPSSSSSWAARWVAAGSPWMSFTTVLDGQTTDSAGLVDEVDLDLRGFRSRLVGERAELAEIGCEPDLQRCVERAVARRRGGRAGWLRTGRLRSGRFGPRRFGRRRFGARRPGGVRLGRIVVVAARRGEQGDGREQDRSDLLGHVSPMSFEAS